MPTMGRLFRQLERISLESRALSASAVHDDPRLDTNRSTTQRLLPFPCSFSTDHGTSKWEVETLVPNSSGSGDFCHGHKWLYYTSGDNPPTKARGPRRCVPHTLTLKVLLVKACDMPPLKPEPVVLLVVPPPSQSTRTPTIVGGVLFGCIFILLVVGCLYYANICLRVARSAPSAGGRGDFFHGLRSLRSAIVREPTAPNHPLGLRTDNILRSFNFRSQAMDLSPRNARLHLAVPPPYEHPPSYEASVSDHTGSLHSPISPSTPGFSP